MTRNGLLMAAPVLIVGALAFPNTRLYAGRCVDACVTGTNFVWNKLLRQPAVPERRIAPDFSLPGADGQMVQLSALRGQVVVLNFWATWCRPCGVEIPWFVEFQKRYANQGLTVIGAALDEEGWKTVRPFLGKMNVNYPVVLGNDALVDSFGKLESVPATLIIDRAGRVAVMHVGLVDKAVYEKEILSMLQERPVQ
jgi:peroxiredoxin